MSKNFLSLRNNFQILEPTDVFLLREVVLQNPNYTNKTFDRPWHFCVCASLRTHATIIYYFASQGFLYIGDAGCKLNKILVVNPL